MYLHRQVLYIAIGLFVLMQKTSAKALLLYSMTSIKGPTLFLSSLSDHIVV